MSFLSTWTVIMTLFSSLNTTSLVTEETVYLLTKGLSYFLAKNG